MTAIFMGASGNQKIQFASGGLDTTLTTLSSASYGDTGGTDPDDCRAYGMAVSGDNFHSLGTFGALGQSVFDDGSSVSRTVTAIYWTEICPGGPNDDDLYFCLSDESMDNDDGDFISIDYNSVNHLRSAATFFPTTGGCSTWRWNDVANGPQSGNPALVVNV